MAMHRFLPALQEQFHPIRSRRPFIASEWAVELFPIGLMLTHSSNFTEFPSQPLKDLDLHANHAIRQPIRALFNSQF